ncbi:MAG: C45 family peptidase [Patescibacteria group bacterium]
MDIKTFSGDFSELGKQQGKIYSKNRMSFKNVKINPKIYENQLRVYKKYYPEILQELEAMAEAGNFDKDKLIYQFICNEILLITNKLNLDKACTIFGVNNKNGIFIGRNYDWIPGTEKFFEAYKFNNPKRNSFIAVTDMAYGAEAGTKKENLFYNVDDAINDNGLFIGLTFAYSDDWSYGLNCIHMTKLIAETCSTTEEAIKVFEKVPLCGPKNFFIADKNGNMVVVEHTSKKFKIIYPKEDVLIQTNHYVDTELANEDFVLKKVPYHNTFIRYYETLQKINFKKSKFLFSDIITVLGTPNSYTCQNFPGIKTIWTLALDMKNQKYKLFWDLFGKRKEKVLKI